MKNAILEVLKDNKIKLTNERKAIISSLEEAKLPLTPIEILFKIRTYLPKANLSTIYRNLEMLEGFGLLRRLQFNKDGFRYEITKNRSHHHHSICKKCGKVEELEAISEKFIEEVTNQSAFKIEDHNLEFFGICSSCQS